MLTLHNKTEAPPGGWRYFVRETSTWIYGSSWNHLLKEVKRHHIANNLPIGLEFAQQIENQLCGMLPAECCSHCDADHARRAATISRPNVAKFIEFTRFLGRKLLGKAKHVSQEQADAQAAVCVRCPLNQKADGCSSCNSGEIQEAVAFALGTRNKHTIHDAKLHSCLLCGCSLKAKCWHKPEDIRAAAEAGFYDAAPNWCWLRQRE